MASVLRRRRAHEAVQMGLGRAVAVASITAACLALCPASATAQINGGAGGAGGAGGGGGGGGFGGGTGGAGGAVGGGNGGTGTGGAGGSDGGGGAGVGGGGGGAGVASSLSAGSPGSGVIATFSNAGAITGGSGSGTGRGGGGAGIGGGGGAFESGNFGGGGAAGFTIGDNTITNAGTITGGSAFIAGSGGAGIGRGGSSISSGGAGLDGITIVNSGTIAGGATSGNTGGDGINGSSLTVINNGGSIAGGNGATRGNAIRFFGGTNSLTLNGGTVTGNVRIDGGTLALTSTGANTITGALTLNAGTTYTVNVSPSGLGGSITTTGATTLAGSVAVRAANGTYAASTTYTILTATGGLTGTFTGVTSDKAFLTPSLTYSATSVSLTLVFSGNNAFQNGARTPNQRAVGSVLDGAAGSASGDFGTVISVLAGLDTTQGPRALDVISGQPYANLGTLGTQSGLAFLEAFGGQAGAARGAAGASGTAGQRASLPGACAGGACDTPTARIGTWITGFGGGGAVRGDGNAAGLNYNLGGVALGADYRVDPAFVVGLGVGFISSRMSTDGFATRATANAYTAALYAAFNQSGFHVDAVAGYAFTDNRMVRTIEVPGLATRQAVGEPVAHQFYGQVEVGYTVPVEAISVTPFVRLQGLTSHQSGFSESGADSLNLNVAARTTNSLRTVVGLDVTAKVERVTLGMRVGWRHEFADVSRPVTAAFAGAPASPFSVNGARPSRDHAVLGLWLDAKLGAAITAYARYDGQVGAGAYDHAGSLGLRLVW